MLSWQSWTSLPAQLQQHAWATNAPEKQNKSASAKPLLPPSLGGSSEPAFGVTVWGRYSLRDLWEEELFPKVPKGCRSLITLSFCCLSALPVLEQGEEQAGLFHVLAIVSLLSGHGPCLLHLLSHVCFISPHGVQLGKDVYKQEGISPP